MAVFRNRRHKRYFMSPRLTTQATFAQAHRFVTQIQAPSTDSGQTAPDIAGRMSSDQDHGAGAMTHQVDTQ
ncbi:MAG: hypothetical protein AB203_01485 [Parcubacteria bacterium C7867-008]|nr:MAG: hypothetical protein AB203_01485 [Parcubacteria bacterium C7867-008]